MYAPPGGERCLREAIAAHLGERRGLACTAEQVLVAPGAQMAIDICARMLADPGDAVWVEDPGYPGARTAFQAARLQVIGMGVDTHGLSPPATLWDSFPPRLVFMTLSGSMQPAHMPTGLDDDNGF